MRVFISASGNYVVMPENMNVVEGMFSSLVQAVSFIRLLGKRPVFTWEV